MEKSELKVYTKGYTNALSEALRIVAKVKDGSLFDGCQLFKDLENQLNAKLEGIKKLKEVPE